MSRKVKYRPISKELELMVKPNSKFSSRPSLGLEGSIGEYFYISVDDLIPFHNQSRKTFDEDEINSLADSIKIYGIRHPLTIIKSENNKYEVVSGERRLRAAKIIGLEKVPCIIINDINQADAIALIENLHRKDLHPIELGQTYKNLLNTKVFSSQSELVSKISVSKSHVSEHLKYADLDQNIQKYIVENKTISREKLRQIVRANINGEKDKILKILGLTSYSNSNFSILRITSVEGQFKFQEKGIIQLTNDKKEELKKYLIQLVERLSK